MHRLKTPYLGRWRREVDSVPSLRKIRDLYQTRGSSTTHDVVMEVNRVIPGETAGTFICIVISSAGL